MNQKPITVSEKQKLLKKLLGDLPLQIRWYTSLSSTNFFAKNMLNEKKYCLPFLIGSDMQTAGYGKKNRQFISKPGGIYLSLIIEVPQLNWQNQGLLTTGVAWQLHEAIKDVFQLQTELKWVNDLLYHNKKVAGILVESTQPQIAIIGIGCNLFQSGLNQELPFASNLLEKEPSIAISCSLIANLVHKLLDFCPNFTQNNFLPKYKKHLALLNNNVMIQLGKQIIYGKVIDLTPMANLVLQTESGVRVFNAGEITKIR